jgi:hypothetical protein
MPAVLRNQQGLLIRCERDLLEAIALLALVVVLLPLSR